MIHIVTVHWRNDRWIDTQLEYLARHIGHPYRVYAFLNDIAAAHNNKFFYVSTEPIESHPFKLNLLADVAASKSDSPDDWLIFLDGDAFPIGDLVAYGKHKLSGYALAAVQRKENNGDPQPHPCFCLTTVGFWKSIHGDWGKGHKWRNNQNELVTDVGGKLLQLLGENNVEWYPMTRSNKKNLHPVFFGVYDDVVYHHGSGFRSGISRMYRLEKKKELEESAGWLTAMKYARRFGYAKKLLARILERRAMRLARMESKRLNEYVFDLIGKDPVFYKIFQ